MARYDEQVNSFFSNIGKQPGASSTATNATKRQQAVDSFFNNLPKSTQKKRTLIKSTTKRPTPKKQSIFDKGINLAKGINIKKLGQSIKGGAKLLPGQLKQAGGIITQGLVSQQRAIDKFYKKTPTALKPFLASTPFFTSSVIKSVSKKQAKKAEKEEKEVLAKAKELRESGVKMSKKAREEHFDKFEPSDGIQGYLEMAAFNLPQIATTVGLSLATAIVTKNPILAGSVGVSTGYGLGASEVYNEAREFGLSDSEALPMAQYGGAIIGAIDFLPIGRLLRKTGAVEPIKKSIVQKVAKGIVSTSVQSGLEGLTESAQEIVANAISSTYNENAKLFTGIKESFIVGALLGGFSNVTVSGVIGALNKKSQPKEVIDKIEKEVQNAIGTTPDKRTSKQNQIVEALFTNDLTPEEVAGFVLDNNLDNTSEGRKIMQVYLEAKDQNKNVRLSLADNEKSINARLVNRTEKIIEQAEPEVIKPKAKQEAQVIEDRLIEEYGITKDINKVAFISSKGELIDQTGAKTHDEQVISVVDDLDIKTSPITSATDYIAQAKNIRTTVKKNEVNIELVNIPNQKQLSSLQKISKGKTIEADIRRLDANRNTKVTKSGTFKTFDEYKKWIDVFFIEPEIDETFTAEQSFGVLPKDKTSAIVEDKEVKRGTEKAKTPDISRRKTRPGGLPDTVSKGEGKPREVEKRPTRPGETTRGERGKRDAELRKRPGTRISVKDQVKINQEIEKLVAKKGALGYSDEEKKLLRQYTGVGGLEKGGGEGRGLLDEYYTPKKMVDFIWDQLKGNFLPKFAGGISGVRIGDILEPAVGIGVFLDYLPESVGGWRGFEVNRTSAAIAQVLHPKAVIDPQPFESMFIDERGNPTPDFNWKNKYDIVITNPPYGQHRGKYLGLGEEPKIPKYEEYFLKRGLDTLSKTGLLAYVMPSGFLRSPVNYAKEQIGKMATIEAAWRFPNGVFGTTDVGTDVVIFRKAGSTDPRFISDDKYFEQYPSRILGKVVKGAGNYGADIVEGSLNNALKLAEGKVKAKPVKISNKPRKIPKGAIPETEKKSTAKVKAPKKIEKAVKTKAIIASDKKDKKLSISKISKDDKELWSNVEVTGELNIEYIKKRFGNIELKDFKSRDIAVEVGTNNLFYPNVLYYQGNIYDKLDSLKARRNDLNPEQYKRQKEKLEKILPKPQTIKEISLKPNSGFAKEIKLLAGDGQEYGLVSEFREWLRKLPHQAFGNSSSWEIQQYVSGTIVNTGDKLRNVEVRKRRREVGDSLFNRYIREELEPSEVKDLENKYNRNYNNYYRPNYKEIPLLEKINSTFKKKPLNLRDLQREGAAFLASKGVGLLGHEVGLGKTMTAIVALNETILRGWTKRPLVVVPNSTYIQWVKELIEIIPDVKINSLYNLGGKFKGDLSTLEIEDGTISLITYEGLTKLGFRMETYDRLTQDLEDVMLGVPKITGTALASKKTLRAIEKERQHVSQVVGRAIKGTTGDRYFEDLGFDHITIDEVHNFKNIFAGAKLPKGTGNEYRNVRGSTSARGIKAYLMAQYILQNNNGRNAFLLSATPFTNSPMEIYSILSLMAKKRLEGLGLKNVNDFMSMFMDMKAKFVVKADQRVVEQDEIERFNNLQQLQKLVTEFIDFRTGEEVNIPRPDRTKKTTFLSPNETQTDYILEAQKLFNDKDKGGAIVAITELQNITLSPFLSRYNETVPTYKSFVENSPKIKFAVEAVSQVRKDNKKVGQVIYMPRGVQFFPLLEQYLIKVKGFKASQIGIIKGAMSVDKKDAVQNKFNKGEIKVLIGTEAMKEGVNLQDNATDLYHLHLPWNPTDILQVEGRIWRQGNAWKNVRITYPLVENSVDSFIFQKLETKEKRIKNLWSYKGNSIPVGDLDFEDMKLDLITDPVIRTRAEETFEVAKEQRKLETLEVEQAFAGRKIEKITNLVEEVSRYEGYKKDAIRDNEDAESVKYFSDQAQKKKKELAEVEADLKKQDINVTALKAKSATFEKQIKAQNEAIDKLRERFVKKVETAKKERVEIITRPNDYKRLRLSLAKENKKFFIPREVSKKEYKKAPGGDADIGGYADVESAEKTVKGISAVEFPELVRIAKELSGDYPTLKHFKKALGRFYVKSGRIKLDYEIFKDPQLAAKVLAHEIGHLSDFLPEKKLARGNLVGRIATLNKHLKRKFKDLDNKVLRKELENLTQLWKPFNESDNPSFTKYRYSSKELYADAISILFNDPHLLQKEAPNFWKGFFDYYDAKPKVKTNFDEIWNLLTEGEEAIYKKRNKEVDKMFKRGEDGYVAKIVERKKRHTSLLYQMKLLFDDRNTPIIEQIKKLKKQGKEIPAELNPNFAMHGLLYLDGKLKNYVNDNFQPIFSKAQKLEDGWNSLGKILFFERVINERGDLANPQGYSPDTAQSQLDKMQAEMSPEDWAVLTDLRDQYRGAVQRSIDNAEVNEYYTPELLKQMKANPAYATYQVIDYLDTYISPRVYQQMGTLKEVANPATATVMKLVSVFKAIERNNAKKLGMEFEKDNFPESIEKAKTRWNGKNMEIITKREAGKDLVVVIEKGKPQGYYLDQDVADVFNYTSNKTLEMAARVSRAVSQSQFYRPLFTTINLGFQTFNLWRDFWRYWKNVPDYTLERAITSLPRAVFRYGQAVPSSLRRAINKPDELVKQMENSKILGLTFNQLHRQELDTEQQQIERLLQQTGILPKTRRRKIYSPILWTLDAIETVGDFIETLPKVAGYIELKDRMPKAEMEEFIRTSVGSPAFRVGGTFTPVTNNIFLFSNAIKEGVKTDFRIATSKNPSRAGFWWKNVLGTFLPKLIMAAIFYGLFGDDLKKMMRKVSEYDRTNYIIIPLGVDENGKTIYQRIPLDETGRLLGGLFWKSIVLSKDRSQAGIEDIMEVLSFGAGQFPNLTPSFTGAGAVITYFSGRNPYDSFRGRHIIPDKEFNAGFDKSFPILLDWLAKNQGLGIVFPRYKPEDPTDLEKLLTAPFLSNIIGRWIKVSDYGTIEEAKKAEKVEKRERARKSLAQEEVVKKYAKEYLKNGLTKTAYKNKIIRELGVKEKAEKNRLKKDFDQEVAYLQGDTRVQAIMRLTLNSTKIKTLNKFKKEMGTREYRKLLQNLRDSKIISDKVYKEVK